ncbi:MAG: sodium/solute symporter [Elusimicrobia bacterium]|nr:sodium/solute symporter [Elusimicrobiota bacterium]
MSGIDLTVVGCAIVLLLVIAYFSGRGEQDTSDFFLARRRIPWWAACLSFVATEISALTIVGVPATGFRENWQYLQFFIGSASARLFIAFLFIPAFYHYNCTTIYEFLRHRFGPGTQYAGSVFFFITRLLASGVRLYAASLAVSVMMGWSLGQAILLFSVVAIAYIAFGGIRAVVWTNVFQASFFYLMGLVTLIFLLLNIQGGFSEIWRVAGEGGRLKLWNLGWNFKDPNLLWIAILNGFFGSMAAFGTDHELMQRLLTVETRKDSQRTMVLTIVAVLPILLMYLSLGTLLYVFYKQNPALLLPDNSDKILSHFATHVMPAGLKGLVLATILLASIDSPLGSLTASFVTDIYKNLIRPNRDERHYLYISRVCVVVFGVILGIMAYQCRAFEGMLWVAFKINGVTAGSLLGVFLLGLLTQRKSNRANVLAMILSSVVMAILLVLSEKKIIGLGWSWLIVFGTVSTFVLGYILGPWMDKQAGVGHSAYN